MKKQAILLCCFCVTTILSLSQTTALREKTSFQTADAWRPEVDIRADVVMVYGANASFEQRLASWREKGYNAQFMTGISWGIGLDYYDGRWDGQLHWRECQIARNGDSIMHGRLNPYIIPTKSYIAYTKEKVIKRIIDAGIDAIYFEEPEIWNRAGYGDAFKDEWQAYYGFPWRPQHESPENTYLANKLKYYLNYRAINEIFSFAKEYGKSKGRNIKCYVPTHSLINYTAWHIVSPEASLASLPCVDGYIGQVWTGTARTANYYNGVKKERVFENAFMEYGCMESMTAPTGRRTYFLTDPIEDWPRDWADYKRNYEATFTAELLYPKNTFFEVMPWPNRIYLGKYKNPATGQQERISPAYATQMQIMINSLNDIPASDNRLNGSQGIGVLMSNSLMFQSWPAHQGYDDPDMSNFYGQTLPLLKRGIPLQLVHMENLPHPQTLKDIKVLVMSYSNMKPLSYEYHRYLADWVNKGGRLIYVGTDNDPFQSVSEWWNSKGHHFKSPSEHLFAQLHIRPAEGKTEYNYGKGKVYIIRKDPKDFVLQAAGDSTYMEWTAKAYQRNNARLQFGNYFMVQRGNYTIASVMDEAASTEPLRIEGPVIDLFDPRLPVLQEKIVAPGHQAYVYRLTGLSTKTPRVLAAACRVYDEKTNDKKYSFIAKSPSGTRNIMRILLPSAPLNVMVKNSGGEAMGNAAHSWDAPSHTLLLEFDNSSDGINVEIEM